MERRRAPAPTAPLGWQRVVVAFAALALAAEHDGSGQEEERGGNQQEQAEASKNPHNLHANIRKEHVNTTTPIAGMCQDEVQVHSRNTERPDKGDRHRNQQNMSVNSFYHTIKYIKQSIK